MIECFMVHPTGSGLVGLRRYSYKECPSPKGYHDAVVITTDNAMVIRDKEGNIEAVPAMMYDGHQRWPRTCSYCPYVFDQHPSRIDGRTDDPGYDQWQVTIGEVWESHSGRQWLFEDLPPGSMYDAFWTGLRGPDKLALAVVLPGGNTWFIDGPAVDGARPWSRTGVAPVVSVIPSVQVDGWVGYLTDGHLSTTEEWAKSQHPAGKG